MERQVNQDNNIVMFELKRKLKHNQLSNRDKIIFAYHYFDQNDVNSAVNTLNTVDGAYWITHFHKDISRALLCIPTYQSTQDPSIGKESEFYLIIYRLTKRITDGKIHFTGSGHFYQLKDELFKGMM